MSYKVIPTSQFEKDLKKLFKKYPSVKSDISALVEQLQDNPKLGTPLLKNCYKIRMAIKSKGKGKSGGSRVITHVRVIREEVHLLSIYDKSEQSNISDSAINNLLELL
ncbi:mRNA-degrading endonuclease RelE, toxin component of the RelBE toxin-antitoxin system [Algoriphagus faecimaris]|uniref:mRNA-degrading endonuclease RelE, toxin component of the RelBE toxin-antitoxin system n=1 Tax=Algoriphagus faecimaris TaxID=686796 RepID=A0A1G6UB03_9BACT|nr:type II toxin-antitoxin system RelE/ParE family toxin [Algoriphagus faecimaris]SDD38439.1 mRNA-degrading endonuclease RelE, toxin component of the RelBE toxin-antitoxin system [Algoriphagus faecimaris]